MSVSGMSRSTRDKKVVPRDYQSARGSSNRSRSRGLFKGLAMSRRHTAWALLLAILLVTLALGCIDLLGVTQPSYVAPAESFQITVSFFAGDDGDADGSTRFGAVMLPVGFSVTGNTFCGTYSLTENATYEAQLTSDYPPDPGYFWWVGTTTHNTATNNCDAVLDVTAGNTTGTFQLDYRAGYNTHYDDQILNQQLQVTSGDSDGDGMPDGWETTHNVCVNPSVADADLDPDNDTITNINEYLGGTDPCVPEDTDGDGMPDWWEDLYACVSSSNPDADQDPDSDSLINLNEYLSSTDPCEYSDTDGDGMSDGWENGYTCVDSSVGDSAENPDGDYFTNLQEFMNSTNPCVGEDTDGDGMPDHWENLYGCVDAYGSDANLDPDNDYYTNLQEYQGMTDPCTLTDDDSDGMPDGWEDQYACVDSAVGDSTLDPDSDTLDNMDEYIGGTVPCVAEDGDGDGMPDWWEDIFACIDSTVDDAALDPDYDTIDSLTEYGNSTDPCSGTDTDDDGMPDAWEDRYACVDSAVGDSMGDPDKDGLTNLEEFNQGRDPCFGTAPDLFDWIDNGLIMAGAEILSLEADGLGNLHAAVKSGSTYYYLKKDGTGWNAAEAIPLVLAADLIRIRIDSSGDVRLMAVDIRTIQDGGTAESEYFLRDGGGWSDEGRANDMNCVGYEVLGNGDSYSLCSAFENYAYTFSLYKWEGAVWTKISGNDIPFDFISPYTNYEGEVPVLSTRLDDDGNIHVGRGAEHYIYNPSSDAWTSRSVMSLPECCPPDQSGTYECYGLLEYDVRYNIEIDTGGLPLMMNQAYCMEDWYLVRLGGYIGQSFCEKSGLYRFNGVEWAKAADAYLDLNNDLSSGPYGWAAFMTGSTVAAIHTESGIVEKATPLKLDTMKLHTTDQGLYLIGAPTSGDLREWFLPFDYADRDGLPTYYEEQHACLDPEVDDASGDCDNDGLTNIDEYNNNTNPDDPDSDDDFMPDGYEANNGLDPLSDDALLDLDGDGNENLHELYNNTEPDVVDPVPGPFYEPGCYYWGDGDGDGVVGPGDVAILQLEVAGDTQGFRQRDPAIHCSTRSTSTRTAAPVRATRLSSTRCWSGTERLTGYPEFAHVADSCRFARLYSQYR